MVAGWRTSLAKLNPGNPTHAPRIADLRDLLATRDDIADRCDDAHSEDDKNEWSERLDQFDARAIYHERNPAKLRELAQSYDDGRDMDGYNAREKAVRAETYSCAVDLVAELFRRWRVEPDYDPPRETPGVLPTGDAAPGHWINHAVNTAMRATKYNANRVRFPEDATVTNPASVRDVIPELRAMADGTSERDMRRTVQKHLRDGKDAATSGARRSGPVAAAQHALAAVLGVEASTIKRAK